MYAIGPINGKQTSFQGGKTADCKLLSTHVNGNKFEVFLWILPGWGRWKLKHESCKIKKECDKLRARYHLGRWISFCVFQPPRNSKRRKFAKYSQINILHNMMLINLELYSILWSICSCSWYEWNHILKVASPTNVRTARICDRRAPAHNYW